MLLLSACTGFNAVNTRKNHVDIFTSYFPKTDSTIVFFSPVARLGIPGKWESNYIIRGGNVAELYGLDSLAFGLDVQLVRNFNAYNDTLPNPERQLLLDCTRQYIESYKAIAPDNIIRITSDSSASGFIIMRYRDTNSRDVTVLNGVKKGILYRWYLQSYGPWTKEKRDAFLISAFKNNPLDQNPKILPEGALKTAVRK